MASLFKSDKVTAPAKPARQFPYGVLAAVGSYTVAAALVVNDVIQMVTVPAGAIILDVLLDVTDLDTATGLVLDVGDGTTTDRFIDGSTIGQTGGIARMNEAGGAGYEYAAEDTIDVIVQVAPTTGATEGTVKLVVLYSMDA